MTIRELLALLQTVPERLLDAEVIVDSRRGAEHVGVMELQRARYQPGQFESVDRPAALERSLKIRGARVLWYDEPPPWRLRGWWPAAAATIGLEEPVTLAP